MIRIKPLQLYATYDTFEELQAQIGIHCDQEQHLMNCGSGWTWNFLAKEVNDAMRQDKWIVNAHGYYFNIRIPFDLNIAKGCIQFSSEEAMRAYVMEKQGFEDDELGDAILFQYNKFGTLEEWALNGCPGDSDYPESDHTTFESYLSEYVL